MNTLSKDDVARMAGTVFNKIWVRMNVQYLGEFAALARADLVAENERLNSELDTERQYQACMDNIHTHDVGQLREQIATPPEYTREIGHAAERYFNSFGADFNVRTPATFRYSELWDAMSQVAYKVKSTCGVCDGKGVITDTENCEWPCYQCKQTPAAGKGGVQ